MLSIYLFMAMICCLIISIVSLGKFLLNVCLREDVAAVGVKQIHKSIEFSAFKDIGATEEHSTDCMILN